MGLDVIRDEGDQQQFDALAVRNKKSGFHYRWARRTDMAIATHEFHGYEVVKQSDDEARSILSSRTRMKKGEDTDDNVLLGDMILMRIPQEKHEQRMKSERVLCDRRERAVTAGFKEAVRKIVPKEHQPEDRTISFEERPGDERNTKYDEGYTEVMNAIEEDRNRSGT